MNVPWNLVLRRSDGLTWSVGNDAEDFTKPLYGVKTWRQADGSYKYEKWQLAERYWKKNWSPKWYLCAFPPEEINKGYGLVQNPGW